MNLSKQERQNYLTSFSKLTRLSRKVLFPSWMNVTSENNKGKELVFMASFVV